MKVTGVGVWCCVTVLGLSNCGLIPEKVAYDDERLQPLLRAIEKVDRAALGFTPLQADAELRLEGRGRNYDAMLHVYGRTSRTIAFRNVGGKFEWIGEQEVHSGPGRFESPDGRLREHIAITYDTVELSGAPLNQIHVDYWGEDPRLAGRVDLVLADVQPVLREWEALQE